MSRLIPFSSCPQHKEIKAKKYIVREIIKRRCAFKRNREQNCERGIIM